MKIIACPDGFKPTDLTWIPPPGGVICKAGMRLFPGDFVHIENGEAFNDCTFDAEHFMTICVAEKGDEITVYPCG